MDKLYSQETCYKNIKTWENEWVNFSDNLRVVAVKFLDLTQFLSPNLSIYCYLL